MVAPGHDDMHYISLSWEVKTESRGTPPFPSGLSPLNTWMICIIMHIHNDRFQLVARNQHMPHEPAHSFLHLGPSRLEYRRYGEPAMDRPTLVLLHEGLGCVELWRDFPDRLARASGCPVLAYSRRGYGRSDGHSPPWPLTYMHEEGMEILPRVLEEASIGEVILVGHSDGASIALIHAGSTARSNLAGLILMAPHVFAEQCTIDSIRQAREAYEQGDLRRRLARYHGDNVDHAFRGWNGAWLDPGFREWNLEQYLPGIQVPLLLIQGEDDQYGTPRQLDAITRQAGGTVTTHLLPACRHAPHLDQPEATLDAICRFLATIPSTTPRQQETG